MGDDCIPTQRGGARLDWLLNYRDKIAAYVGFLGLNPKEVSEVCGEIESCVAARGNISQLRNRVHDAWVSQRHREKSLEERIRTQVVSAKSIAMFTEEIRRQLWIDDGTTPFDPDTSQPSFHLMVEAGAVRVYFEKGQFDAVNIYCRISGQPAWRFIARDTNSPYLDCSPPAAGDTAEIREYVLRGVIDDLEIGKVSAVQLVNCGDVMRDGDLQPRKRVGRWA